MHPKHQEIIPSIFIILVALLGPFSLKMGCFLLVKDLFLAALSFSCQILSTVHLS